MFHSGSQIMALMKYFKRIKPSKEERIQTKPDCPLACLMLTLLSSAIYKLLIASAIYIWNEMKLGRWVSVYAFIDLKLYGGKA